MRGICEEDQRKKEMFASEPQKEGEKENKLRAVAEKLSLEKKKVSPKGEEARGKGKLPSITVAGRLRMSTSRRIFYVGGRVQPFFRD